MKTVQKAIPIHEAKANLSKYIKAAKAGETIYIGSYGEVEVMLVAAPKPKAQSLWGAMKGDISTSWEEWEAMDKEMAAEMEYWLDKDVFDLGDGETK